MGAGAIGGHKTESSSYHPEPFCSTSNSFDKLKSEESSSSAWAESSHSTLTSDTASRQSSGKKPVMKMSCEMCFTNFTIFKRKKFCQECHRYFCSTCLPKPPATKARAGRQCSKCQLLMSGQFSRTDLQDWKVKDMRCFLAVRKISMIGCTEKHDLIELVLAHFCTKRRNSLQDQEEHDILVQAMAARMQNDDIISTTGEQDDDEAVPTAADEIQPQSKSSSRPDSSNLNQETPSQNAENSSQESAEESRIRSEQWQELFDSMERIQELFSRHNLHEEMSSASDANVTSSPGRRRCHIDDIHTEEEIDSLSVKQIKELLVNNFVDFKGCCEKQEVIERVKRLWRDHQVNKSKAEKIHQRDEAEAAARSAPASEGSSLFAAAATTDTESDKKCEDETPSPTPEMPSSTEIPSDKTKPVNSMQQNDSLCRVCMDVLSDCILLECGHMVTCTACGKQLAECPICRQYIARVVRVFRS